MSFVHVGPFFVSSKTMISGKDTFEKILKDDLFTQSAALALYTAFSLAPLVILLISFLSTLQLDLQSHLISHIENLMGSDAARVLESIIIKAESRKDLTTISGWAGSLTLLFSASIIFGQLQTSLNIIFQSSMPKNSLGPWFKEVQSYITRRLISFGIVLSFIFISIVSLIFSSFLSMLVSKQQAVSGGILNALLGFIIFTGLFSAIFKWIPDRPINNTTAIKGGVLTAVLFLFGKGLIGMYLGQTAVGSAYGAAGSIIVLLLWVYYSSLIILVGAEIASMIGVPSEYKSQLRHKYSTVEN